MKRLYATVDPTEAQALRALLRHQGIESTLESDGGIHVSDEDAPAAAETLARHFETQDPAEAAPMPGEPAPFDRWAPGRHFGRRLFLLVVFFFPGILGLVFWFPEPWQMALVGAAGVLSLVAFIWVLDLIAENKAGPPPDSGNGPAQKSS